MIWRDYCNYYKNVVGRLRLYLISKHKRDVLAAFMRLREAADTTQYVTLLEENENQVNINQDLVNEVSKKREKVGQQEVQSGKMQQTRLERVLNFVDRKRMKAFLLRWAQGTERICNLETALFKTGKTCYKNKLRNNFNKWKAQARAKGRA